MATVKAYRNGVTMGVGNPCPTGGRRGEVVGWSRSAVQRHKRWLYGVDAPRLSGKGYAVTLTMRDCPASSDEWSSALQRFLQRVRDMPGFVRLHWVVEWQRRGTPHVHMAVYVTDSAAGSTRSGWRFVEHWLSVTAGWRSAPPGQHVRAIDGPVGWLQYLSKHAARGVAHYQRCGRPAGWDRTGRLWGYRGAWPVVAPLEASLTPDEYWRLRRSVRSCALAAARARASACARAGDRAGAAVEWQRVSYLRRMLKCGDRRLSAVRGVSEWVPEAVMVDLLSLAAA